ncbi:hypothetical protein BG004_000434 [Podila humilis]|nr:hypothetical protein BG004_000434 [Podila humilis]
MEGLQYGSEEEDRSLVLERMLQSCTLQDAEITDNHHKDEEFTSALLLQFNTLSLNTPNAAPTTAVNSDQYTLEIQKTILQQKSIEFQLEWDVFVQHVQHLQLRKQYLESLQPFLRPEEYRERWEDYLDRSIRLTIPKFFDETGMDSLEWLIATAGEEGYQILTTRIDEMLEDMKTRTLGMPRKWMEEVLKNSTSL